MTNATLAEADGDVAARGKASGMLHTARMHANMAKRIVELLVEKVRENRDSRRRDAATRAQRTASQSQQRLLPCALCAPP